jgi:ketosteroid isomerase-like protein
MALTAASAADAASEDTAPVISVVNAFHDALGRGDSKAAMELLAPDAVILESGSAETRAQYEEHHLKEDITFAREVKSTRALLKIQVEGAAAWIIHTSRTTGSLRGRQIDSTGTELMVLGKNSLGWRIRAIHWSSHDAKRDK